MSKHILASNIIVIRSSRYWLTDNELKSVNEIKKIHPNTWEDVVIHRMKKGNL